MVSKCLDGSVRLGRFYKLFGVHEKLPEWQQASRSKETELYLSEMVSDKHKAVGIYPAGLEDVGRCWEAERLLLRLDEVSDDISVAMESGIQNMKNLFRQKILDKFSELWRN